MRKPGGVLKHGQIYLNLKCGPSYGLMSLCSPGAGEKTYLYLGDLTVCPFYFFASSSRAHQPSHPPLASVAQKALLSIYFSTTTILYNLAGPSGGGW
jgi:hypothetical protein